jgi:hypothetical protein
MSALREISKAEDVEWKLRCDLAAVFRVCSRLGWNEQIGNHHSLMLPGNDNLFLINPRGMLFQEATASCARSPSTSMPASISPIRRQNASCTFIRNTSPRCRCSKAEE